VGRVLFRYLIVKLKMFAGSLLFALDHSELSFCRELSKMNHIIKPFDFSESEVYRCGQREWISRPVSYFCTCRTEHLPHS